MNKTKPYKFIPPLDKNEGWYCLKTDGDGGYYIIPVEEESLFAALLDKAIKHDNFDDFLVYAEPKRINKQTLQFTNWRESHK